MNSINMLMVVALPAIITLILTPLILKMAIKLNLYTQTNERTVHSRKIPQLGGIAIFLAFSLSLFIFFEPDITTIALYVGSFLIFITGLYDDVHDMKAIIKLGMQILAAITVITFGDISIDVINLPFDVTIHNTWILNFVTFCWIIGVTNAINLIDGLDGLASGISLIVLVTLVIVALSLGKFGAVTLMLIIIGTLIGFIPFNFYPAKMFLGDCGAQFLGFILSCITIVSFKSTTLITFLVPFVVLFIPLMDTILAIVRRALSGKKITDADKSHLHHILMFNLKLGHRRTVIILYIISATFGVAAITYLFDRIIGTIVLIFLIILFDIFIEYTGMINPNYHPILSLFRMASKGSDE